MLATDSYLQNINYSYNPRGWLTAINDHTNLENGPANQIFDDLFALRLYYNTSSPTLASPNYNGNISAMHWRSAQDNVLYAYGFAYDDLNRLTAAYQPPTTGADPLAGYSEACTYNPAGGITSLIRTGIKYHNPTPVWGNIDKLTYTYAPSNPNQPLFIDDEVTDTTPTLNDFKDNGSQYAPANSPEYAYDANGNLIIDGNKSITTRYNHLNLPTRVTFSDGKTISWIYTATGKKLQKRTCQLRDGSAPINISDAKRPDYIDQHRHQSERIKHISTRRNPDELTLSYTDYYAATQTKIQTATAQPYTPAGTPPLRTYPPAVVPIRESCTLRDYILGLEYLNQQQEGYYHEEGRINLLAGNRTEYTLKDHLGNGRVYFYHNASTPGNPLKIQQTAHYYPFGLPIQKLSPNFEAPVGVEANAYQYNGIERVEDFGLEVSHAQFRTLDAQTGRWWQIDPMAEKFYAWSPYNSNLNNPIRYNDPKGDTPGPGGTEKEPQNKTYAWEVGGGFGGGWGGGYEVTTGEDGSAKGTGWSLSRVANAWKGSGGSTSQVTKNRAAGTAAEKAGVEAIEQASYTVASKQTTTKVNGVSSRNDILARNADGDLGIIEQKLVQDISKVTPENAHKLLTPNQKATAKAVQQGNPLENRSGPKNAPSDVKVSGNINAQFYHMQVMDVKGWKIIDVPIPQ